MFPNSGENVVSNRLQMSAWLGTFPGRAGQQPALRLLSAGQGAQAVGGGEAVLSGNA